MLRHASCLALFASLACTVNAPATAQSYPSKSIRMIVPIAPGGSTDMVGRLIGQRLSEQMGVTVYVDNRPGAGATIGSELVAKAPADGYTLLTIAVEFTINPNLRKLPYDPIRDFACVTQLTSSQYFLSTHPAVPVKSVQQFIGLARSRPGEEMTTRICDPSRKAWANEGMAICTGVHSPGTIGSRDRKVTPVS